ncbi:MAG: cellulose synthase [Actinobacteria bacterium]|nr:cellulose synthase [Actinomycetota bacterium]MBU2111313.1 cellulose synthase [Actinomycetota bacterium]
MDDAAWTALALALTIVGGLYTWRAHRRRGLAAGMRGAGLTLLVPAAWLTDTLRMFTRIVDAVGDWALGLVFSPLVWVGVVLGGVGALLLVVSGILTSRQLGTTPRSGTGPAGATKEVGPAERRAKSEPAIDDDLADIEALLRRRGIS